MRYVRGALLTAIVVLAVTVLTLGLGYAFTYSVEPNTCSGKILTAADMLYYRFFFGTMMVGSFLVALKFIDLVAFCFKDFSDEGN